MRGFLFLILFVVNVRSVPVFDFENETGIVYTDFSPVAINPVASDSLNVNNGTLLSGQLFKTVRKYFCSINSTEEKAITLLYGVNGWTFPEQDVNLTLTYPTANKSVRQAIKDIEDYVITGYQIILFSDGSESSGFITAGGLLQNHITLSFIMSKITMLSYEFWLYGVPSSKFIAALFTNQMCK